MPSMSSDSKPQQMHSHYSNILKSFFYFSIFSIFLNSTYISRNGGNPLFPIPLWNHHDSVLNNQARTNNAIEGYHRALRSRFPSPKPLLSKYFKLSVKILFINLRLIFVLKEEERFMQDKIRVYELDPTRGVSSRPRSKKYTNNDAAIKQLVQNFDQNANPTNEQILAHLRAIQYRLGQNEFDNWDN